MAGFQRNSTYESIGLRTKPTRAVLFPNNPIARASVTRYLAALRSVYLRIASGPGGGESHSAMPSSSLEITSRSTTGVRSTISGAGKFVDEDSDT